MHRECIARCLCTLRAQGVCYKMRMFTMCAQGVCYKMCVFMSCPQGVHYKIRVFTPCPQGVCYKMCVFTLCPQGVDEAYDQQVYSFFIPYHMLLDTLQRLAININSFDEPLINLGQCLPPPPSSRLLPWLVPVFFLH